uniref:Uncharacterized protein n=1 Tax=Vespula pensylvanica TaxID=30213 RepID=A0A834JU53_VESPE|nr:hypothetical protein H0235_016775 [Vespula pensylvanica]
MRLCDGCLSANVSGNTRDVAYFSVVGEIDEDADGSSMDRRRYADDFERRAVRFDGSTNSTGRGLIRPPRRLVVGVVVDEDTERKEKFPELRGGTRASLPEEEYPWPFRRKSGNWFGGRSRKNLASSRSL